MNSPSQILTTRTGFRFRVRPARPADEGMLAEFFTHVTHDDLRFRYLTGLNEIGQDRIAALANVDHRQTEDFLVFAECGSPMIATGVLACNPTFEKGEVAISIRNDYKRRGISWELLAHIAHYAEMKGVKTLQSIESRDNHAAIELERDMGFTAEECPGDPTLVLVSRKLEPCS